MDQNKNEFDTSYYGAPKPGCVPTDAQSIDAIAAAEARIAAGLANYLDCFLRKVVCLPDLEKQAELVRLVLCAYACKEKAIAAVINALAVKILADKGPQPCNDCC
jgi:hypothetical protein